MPYSVIISPANRLDSAEALLNIEAPCPVNLPLLAYRVVRELIILLVQQSSYPLLFPCAALLARLADALI